ncbi:unnamed protein product, partial [Iphiclides podalirius]
MECTQRLDCLTQELNGSSQERTLHEQIGFLGICGTKYPVIKGPNKVGRDPQTCNIVLDLNSISRQHAVINILNSTEFMIMDLDSANKTKLLNKTLPPYIPHPLKNGDTVQFGQVFGIFRLLEDDDDLPMTQALDIPDTPVVNRHVTKLNNLPSTTIPESPDCSDKDESYIVSSQSKNYEFKSPNSHYIKTSGKTIAIQSVGMNKIDNIYWQSSKKSVSIDMGLDDSNQELVVTDKSLKTTEAITNQNIHEMDTQVPFPAQRFEAPDAIYTANTQLSSNGPSVSGVDGHLIDMNNLPYARKINEHHEMELDLFTENKENNNSIYNAETQAFAINNDKGTKKQSSNERLDISNEGTSNPKLNISDEEIIFDEVDSQPLPEVFESQPLLLPEILNLNDGIANNNDNSILDDVNFKNKQTNRTRLNSDSSTDCDDFDMLPTQKIQEKPECGEQNNKIDNRLQNVNDDSTDCEDNLVEFNKEVVPTKCTRITLDDNDSTDCEDDIIPCNTDALKRKASSEVGFEDLATQVITMDRPNVIEDLNDKPESNYTFEDMPTQIIEEIDKPKRILSIQNTNEANEQMDDSLERSPFKVPLHCFKKNKKKEITRPDLLNTVSSVLEEDNFYEATQDILNDLCTQKDTSNEEQQPNTSSDIKNRLDPKNKRLIADKSSESSDGDDKINKYAAGLSSDQIKDIIGIDEKMNINLKKTSSDSSDVESTPRKQRPIKFMETELPDSQEIKKSVTLKPVRARVETATESETENDAEEQCTPIVSRKRKCHKNTKIDLRNKFESDLLPTRVLTRIRKPTAKAQSMGINNMLKCRLLAGSEEIVDMDIIAENMLRLKTKTSKQKVDGEVKTEDRQSHEANNEQKPLVKQLNSEESYERINGKRKSNDSDDISKSEKDHNDRKKNKSIKISNDNTKLSTARKPYVKSPTEKKTDDKPETKKVMDVQNIDKQSETSAKPSQKTRGRSQAEIKQEKSNVSKNKAAGKRLQTQKDETKETHKDDISSNVTSKRNSRSRRKEEDRENESKTSTKEKIDASDRRDKRKRNAEDRSKNESSPEKEVRRSKRQRTTKNDSEANSAQSISSNSNPTKHEQSTVYSISDESRRDSPIEKSMKRPARDDSVNCFKKGSVSNTFNTSLRVTPRNIKTHKVLFTAFPCEEVKVKLEKLGAVVVTEVAECTVLLTLQIKRTFKLLCAIGLGRPIVGPSWVQACADTNMIVDPWQYIIKDEAAEKRFQFNLEQTLTGKRNFLQGYNVSSTPSVMPNAMEMKLIVECSGGTWREGGSKWICISTPADKALWVSLERRGAILASSELILKGVLRQKLEIVKLREH